MSLYDAYVKSEDQRVRAAEVVVDSMVPINWRALIDGLIKQNISMKRIGTTIGVSHETVRGWRQGSIPNYETGRKLLALCATARIPVVAEESEGV